MIAPLRTMLTRDHGFTSFTSADDISIQTLFRVIYNPQLLTQIPLYLNHRETMSNVKIVTTAIVIVKRNYLSLKEIRAGLIAFELIEKELKETNLPLKEDVILKALRLINKTVSGELVKQWIRRNKPSLECEKPERKEFEKYVRMVERDLKARKGMVYPDDKDSQDKLFPHEFLFLLCNAVNRNDVIPKLQKPEMTTVRRNIKRYEMQPWDALRLDHLYHIDLKTLNESYNPKDMMQVHLNNEVA